MPSNPPGKILETVLYVDDLDAAEAYFRDHLGLVAFTRKAGRHVFYRVGEQVLLLFDAKATRIPSPADGLPVPTHGTTGQGHVCFAATASELDVWRTRLEAGGVTIEADFTWPSGGRSIYFRDPSGNSLEFAEPRIWGLE